MVASRSAGQSSKFAKRMRNRPSRKGFEQRLAPENGTDRHYHGAELHIVLMFKVRARLMPGDVGTLASGCAQGTDLNCELLRAMSLPLA
jgi:hypothetical protein